MIKLVAIQGASERAKQVPDIAPVALAALSCTREHERLVVESGGEPHTVMDYIQFSGNEAVLVVIIGPASETNLRGFIRELADHPDLFDPNEHVKP